MKVLLIFIKEIIVDTLKYVILKYRRAVIQSKNPSCKIYNNAKISNTIFGKYNVIFDNVILSNSIIGDHTYIQKNSTIFNAKIGKYCSIAPNVSIGPGIHKVDGISTHPTFFLRDTPILKKYSNVNTFDSSKKVIIGNDVWIGEKAIIIDGVIIVDGAIVAAGAVVTKNIDPYAVVGGIPAKVIKYRFSETDIKQLLRLKWWDKDEVWIQANTPKFSDNTKVNLLQ